MWKLETLRDTEKLLWEPCGLLCEKNYGIVNVLVRRDLFIKINKTDNICFNAGRLNFLIRFSALYRKKNRTAKVSKI